MRDILDALTRAVPAEEEQRTLRAAWLIADQVERAALSLSEALSKRLGELLADQRDGPSPSPRVR
ncbi:MAG: hypothetical protein A3C70_00270 [Candidatus Zambryskibacteria bacterium RIFCSPHIGHO2_02_FULL_43_14]|uniref:Uncharacterized protein n=1 Tax=Candidatus Zambryskibacteria bacterium RIFCSPHIGHO2_02_FULL_43_14 TaxID=1802748 RepID=A0A1G2TFC7_9BACT|nr:MAG: hypothetical protein A2829_03320 [Candidatus Zambryskibacteria bacterium RIFCSPHIGHO2_01_FULL_43_60]OHA95882.1 MAG: hypothetical protein A3C70_00270 [Candidatus Zambryskibacteria bacterium RIFCSPHIGHO2_02_FULL_43_14]